MKRLETVLSVVAIIIAVITLLFGDNIYERVTGRSIGDDWRRLFSSASTTPEASSSKNEQFLLQENFSDGLAQNFDAISGNWKIVSDNGNMVWDIDNTNGTDSAGVNFGAESWQDYVISYRAKMVNFVPNATPEIILYLRTDFAGKSDFLAFTPDYNGAKLLTFGKQANQPDWVVISTKVYPFVVDKWYIFQIKAQGAQFKILIDNEPIFDATDDRVLSGYCNLLIGAGAHVQFDDIEVKKIQK